MNQLPRVRFVERPIVWLWLAWIRVRLTYLLGVIRWSQWRMGRARLL